MSLLEAPDPEPSLRSKKVGMYQQGFRWCKKCGEKRTTRRCPVCHLLTRGRDFNWPPTKKLLAEKDSRPITEEERALRDGQ